MARGKRVSDPGHRGSIALERAEILAHHEWPGNQFVLRLHAPGTSERARPGTFVHLQCAGDTTLRRPLSIMRTDASGWIELLYKPVGAGLAALTRKRIGESLSLLGPIGNGFEIAAGVERVLALGGGVGIPPMVFSAQRLRERDDVSLTVYMGSEVPFPFDLQPATLSVPGVDINGRSAVGLLQTWGIASVLTSRAGLPGAFDGYVTDLAACTLNQLSQQEKAATALLACGPEPMLAAAARLAREHRVSCQLALEEYMACGVGGCAGCTVEVHTGSGISMQRVCVDGPVFEAEAIYPAA